MIVQFDKCGNLPEGIHPMSWDEILQAYGNNFCRKKLLRGLNKALHEFKYAGCKIVYLDGSFVTTKQYPNDYDCCWVTEGVNPDLLDRSLQRYDHIGRKMQKIKYYGEFFPSNLIEKSAGSPFLDFFQTDRETDERKGIVKIDLVRFS
jgi:hypothetical protein